jgi:hypothetical protein
VSFFSRSGDDAEPLGGLGGSEEIRRVGRTSTLAVGTLACPGCDAPVAPGPHRLGISTSLECPYCGHLGRVRDFLTLGAPSRPAHVLIKVVAPAQLRILPRPDRD